MPQWWWLYCITAIWQRLSVSVMWCTAAIYSVRIGSGLQLWNYLRPFCIRCQPGSYWICLLDPFTLRQCTQMPFACSKRLGQKIQCFIFPQFVCHFLLPSWMMHCYLEVLVLLSQRDIVCFLQKWCRIMSLGSHGDMIYNYIYTSVC